LRADLHPGATINQMEIGSRLSFDWGPLRDALQAAGGIGRMASTLNGLVMQQATMIAFLDDFKLMMWVTLAALPIVLLLRRPKRQPAKDPAPPAPAIAE
jgi:DHA2 family multidrug resistance protein